MSRFFIRRPIVAIVIAILTVILGAVTLFTLPISQFPNIVPPEIQVQATYVGADAQTMEQSVAVPIEQQMSGVDNMNYMTSVNAGNGPMMLTVDFDVSTDPNTDLILSQMRVTQATPRLPVDVSTLGVTVTKSLSVPMMLIGLYSPKGTYDANFLANYARINLNDQLTRVAGVGNVQVFGAGEYAMRIWVRPDKMAAMHLTMPDIINAVQAQNTVNPAGQVGGEPIPPGQEFTYSVRAQGRLTTPEEFGNIVVRESAEGGIVRLHDVARVEMGSQDYSIAGRLNGKPSAILALYQLPGSNALAASKGVRALLDEARKRLPADVDFVISLDTTLAVTAGIRDIVITLGISILLVTLVVFLFLQNWRATLIPLLAVPVSLVGTFMFFPLFGFSVNTLSLFGLVLAIGLVVDDAIVVVEAVERHIEHGLTPTEAALKATDEISGPVIGIALVLSAVFVPTIFVPGITGRLYQQFAMTIAISVVLSAFNALSLSAALCSVLLRPHERGHDERPHGFFALFNRLFARATAGYVTGSSLFIRKSAVTGVLLVLCAIGAAFFNARIPSSFLPTEDQGYAFITLQLPSGASMQRTTEVAEKIEHILENTPGVKYTTVAIGFDILSFARTTYNAIFFITLDDWDARNRPGESLEELQMRLNTQLAQLPDGFAFSLPPPSIPGVGASSGFEFNLEDRAGRDVPFLAENLNRFLTALRKRPQIGVAFSGFNPSVPQQFVDVERDKVLKQNVPLGDVYKTIQAFMGGVFVNYFNRFGRQWQVYVEADGSYRSSVEKLNQFYVRNNNGDMVSLAGMTKFRMSNGPEYLTHFNMYRSAKVLGTAAPGYSSAQAMQALEEVFRETMPREMGYDYSGMSYQEKKAQEGVPRWVILMFSIVFVFLILAALYESWSLPFSVLLSTPVAIFGALGMLWLRRTVLGYLVPPYMIELENDLYSQIGLVMLIGLAAKNAILIVEFAKEELAKGRPPVEAALEGARLRLRPILMTSFAFILGCVPLWWASGAGSISREIMGTTVIGGMLAASFIGVFFIPALFCMVERLSRRRHRS